MKNIWIPIAMGDRISQYVIECYYKKYLVINSNIIIYTVKTFLLHRLGFVKVPPVAGASLQYQKGGITTMEEYLQQLKSFHGSMAPGLIIGGAMDIRCCRNKCADSPGRRTALKERSGSQTAPAWEHVLGTRSRSSSVKRMNLRR